MDRTVHKWTIVQSNIGPYGPVPYRICKSINNGPYDPYGSCPQALILANGWQDRQQFFGGKILANRVVFSPTGRQMNINASQKTKESIRKQAETTETDRKH